MSTQATIKRFSLIIEKVSSNLYPSFQKLQEYLSDHFEISDRTLQRDIEKIRLEFGLEIIYDRAKNGYYIKKDEDKTFDSFLRFLEIVATADLLTQSFKEGKDALKYISFEAEGSLKGIENLKIILSAIRNRRKISFMHNNYTTGTENQYLIAPYLLREYQNRWYVIGKIGLNYRTFGIDRIENLKKTTEVFTISKNEKPTEFFENIIGLNYSGKKIEKVDLAIDPIQGKYVKSLPLHNSQEIISDDKKGLIISLRVIPNFELQQKILEMGDMVKVLEPVWLVREIKEVYRRALKKYSR